MSSKRVYFDTSVYMAVFLDEPGNEGARAAIADAEQGDTHGHFSGLVMAEAIGTPELRAPQGKPDPAWEQRLAKAVEYFKSSKFTYVEESRRAGERAMELAVQFGLKGPDALHLALAEGAGCEEFHSLDTKHLRVGEQVPTIRVVGPYGSPQSEIGFAAE